MSYLIYICPTHGAQQRQGPRPPRPERFGGNGHEEAPNTIRCPRPGHVPPLDIPLRLIQEEGPILNVPPRNLPATPLPVILPMTRARRPWPPRGV